MKNIARTRLKYKWIVATVILLASVSLIAINFYSVKLLASVRGFRNAQFVYVRAQKSAVRLLSLYVYNQKPEYYNSFNANIAIPIADSLARKAWEAGKPNADVKKLFLQGKNLPGDINNMLWLLQNFSEVDKLHKGIRYWQRCDYYIADLHVLGKKIYHESKGHALSDAEKEHYTAQINQLCLKLDNNEERFSNMLVDSLSKISRGLLILNIIFIVLVFLNLGLFFIKIMQQLNDALQQIEAQNRAKEEFLSVASHELKSPITFMKASIQILERFAKNTPETKKIHPFIVNSAKQVDRLNHLVKELLDVTKIQSGKLLLNKEEFHLDELVMEAVEEKRHLHTHELHIERLAGATVKADPNRIYQVLENLLSNAIKYSPVETEIKVWSETDVSHVKVFIKDRGKGIPKEKLAMLFERYYRVESTQHSVQGLGLGLYICSEIIKSHHGEIGVESEVDEGSTFWFTLPIIHKETDAGALASSTTSARSHHH